jgi:hypothetical protein
VVIYKFKYKEWHAGCVYGEFSFFSDDGLRPIFGQNWIDLDGYDYGGYGVVRG